MRAVGARLLPLAGLSLGLLGAGCHGVSPASGLSALMRASNAQYEPGELGTGDPAEKPTVDSIKSNNTRVFPGAQGRSVSGSASGTATAVLIGLEGDSAHWLVPVGAPDLDMVGNFTFGSSLSFSPDLPPGPRSLRFRAIDDAGRIGPAQALTLKVDDPLPSGKLVIQLDWDTEADLDLHVRIPNPANPDLPYFDVWAKEPRGLPPPPQGTSYSEGDLDAGGRLLFDSNGQCVIDGEHREFMVFPTVAPPGEYEVRVDTFSLCAETTARWHVAAFSNLGEVVPLAEASGQSTDRDTAGAHTGGSGVLAFTFTP
jgi:hypothetical protein